MRRHSRTPLWCVGKDDDCWQAGKRLCNNSTRRATAIGLFGASADDPANTARSIPVIDNVLMTS